MKSQHRKPLEKDNLLYKLAGNDNLRMKVISLAIEHDEIELLYQLRARENFSLYQVSCYTCRMADCDSFYDEDMVYHVARASEPVLDYFSEEFEIKGSWGHINKFLFPYMSTLIDFMIKEHNEYLERLIRRSIEHNKNIYNQLKESINNSINCQVESIKANMYHNDKEYIERSKKYITESIMREFDYYDNGDFISFRDATGKDGIGSNIIHVNEKSSEKNINLLIQELNDTYDKIRNIKDEYKI